MPGNGEGIAIPPRNETVNQRGSPLGRNPLRLFDAVDDTITGQTIRGRFQPPRPAMPLLIAQPSRIQAAGNKPKLIDEFVGRVNTNDAEISIARMQSPSGWCEPGQAPEFDEFTVVLRGSLRVEHRDGVIEVAAGQGVVVRRGEWVRYSTPGPEGAEYVAVCLPAFSLDAAHRDS
jgi:mannose-6-phosphate isomerase-like protein (cupin superfamily)